MLPRCQLTLTKKMSVNADIQEDVTYKLKWTVVGADVFWTIYS